VAASGRALPPFFDASKVRDALNETSINDLETGQLEMLEKWDWGVENFFHHLPQPLKTIGYI
jgi:hypothetical protein